MAYCEEEHDAVQNAQTSEEYQDALERYEECLKQEAYVAKKRTEHLAAWDEKLYQLQKDLQAARERLTFGIKEPPKPSCGRRSIEIRHEMLGTRRNGMLFSEKIDEAFKESGIKLQDDETYACVVCVVKKPEYVTEALALNPLNMEMAGDAHVNYILEPAIMESVMKKIEKDKIIYQPKERT